jgi:hypothetical protein
MPTFKTGSKSFLSQDPPPVPPAGPAEILEIQARLVQEGSDLAQVNAKSEEIEQEIVRLNGGAPPAPFFDAPRESILADIALGNLKTDDLVKFDREVFDAKKKYDAIVKMIREKTSPLESTIAGLRHKAAKHNRTIAGLRAEHKTLCQGFLLAQAEEAGKEYAAAIHAAVEAMARAVALGSLHKRIHGENSIGENYEAFDAIGLGLESTKSLPPTDPAAWVKRFDDAEEEVLASLKNEGLAVPFPDTVPAKPARAYAPGIGEGTPVSIVRPLDDRFSDGYPRPAQAIHDFDPYKSSGE